MRFFTSDHHFGHRNIITFCDRPFNSLDHMNAVMVALWNEVVSDEDTVYHLGDFAMGDRGYTLDLALALNGTKILVPGNHDSCWRGWKKPSRLDHYERYFDVQQGPVEISLSNNQTVALNHFPGRGVNDAYDRKFQKWEYEGDLWLLHGHTHSPIRSTKAKKLVHVGVDAWGFRPVSEEAVIDIIG